MKFIFSVLLCIICLFSFGQKITPLKSVDNNDTIRDGYAVICGLFVQRLGFSSGGFPQEIRIENAETKEVFSFVVKPTFVSRRENVFCNYLKPGTYTILNYWWIQSKWYGGKTFLEPIYKNVDSSNDFDKRVASGKVVLEELKRYQFTVKEEELYYLGTWHFNTGMVSFTDNKKELAEKMNSSYKRLGYGNAITILPE